MLEIEKKRNREISTKVIKNLAKRNIEGFFVENIEEANAKVLELIPEGKSVGWGGSYTIDSMGIKDILKERNYPVIDRETARNKEERWDMMRQCLLAHTFLMSTNAISEDGVLVNLDGVGNRVSALIFGPEQVIIVAGMNKLCYSEEEAISRTRHYAAPVNTQRFAKNTPCVKNGSCANCLSDECICNQLVITHRSSSPTRIKVILVNEKLGF